ncbi:hypothetical protein EI427_05715 [Flammeovirga pectinis]|uniref:Carbohydrate porin n=1 Tax=Flammeovirga pectinis TaxID=2494373 RepID=A0A3S9P0P0_9BACT|nr:carbohydrate porin [Flammeovirga pectinis]AZQ61748.1 hypothetical protein EI427_05715 [Flammeovirga pectinis]
MQILKKLLSILILILLGQPLFAQERMFEFHSYGRVGVSSSLYEDKVGARLNLTGQGALGGRLEENDYIEMTGVARIDKIFKMTPDKPKIKFVLTTQSFSGDNTFIANNTKTNFVEMYLDIQDTLLNVPFHLWVGSKYFRDKNIDIADYFQFNNLTGQGFGLTVGKTTVSLIKALVSQDQPNNPYGDSNYEDGRQKHVLSIQHVVDINEYNKLNFLGEYHFTGYDSLNDPQFIIDKVSDYGWLLGVMHSYKKENFFNNVTLRYGSRIANGPGDDGWSSRSFINFGNPNNKGQYDGARGINITENFVYDVNKFWGVTGYAVYRYAMGAKLPVYISENRPNQKWDLSIGVRPMIYLMDKIQLMLEYNFQLRDFDEFTNGIVGVDPGLGQMNKFTFAPVYVPTGERSVMARPQIRLVYTIAVYNDVVKDYQLSQYYEAGNAGNLGHYLGLKTEWWF